MSHRFCSQFASWASVAALALAVQPVFGVVVIETDFTAAEGYNDGKLQFQQPNGPDNGIWLGQFNDLSGGPAVDSTGDGSVNVIGGTPPQGGDAFLRNIWNTGATGGLLGGSNPETGSGFTLGDRIQVDVEFVFEIPNGTQNHDLFVSGVRDCFATCGFDAAPTAGINLGLSEFEAGNLKVFTRMDRSFTSGANNPFALFVSPADIGIDNGFNPDTGVKDLPTDLVSDTIMITYTAELIDDSIDLWTATEVVVTNVDTATEVARATTDKPESLESFIWNSTSVDDPFTDENEGGVAVSTGSDMWFGTRWLDSVNDGAAMSFDSVRFEYLPAPGDPVAGDYNGNGIVDAADYTVWRDSLGSVGGGLPADGTGDNDLGVPDGDVDQFDYQFWANRFGNAAAVGVPEPSAAALLVLGVLGGMRIKKRG